MTIRVGYNYETLCGRVIKIVKKVGDKFYSDDGMEYDKYDKYGNNSKAIYYNIKIIDVSSNP